MIVAGSLNFGGPGSLPQGRRDTSYVVADTFSRAGGRHSMKLGGEYRLRNIGLYHWRKLAEELHVNLDAMIQRVDDFARQLADHVSDIRNRMTEEGLSHPIIPRLAEALTTRAAECRKILKRP